MVSHDPREFVENLRNHLAARDRRLVFLFGAGTSCSINVAPQSLPGSPSKHVPLIPDVALLTNTCADAITKLGDAQKAAWKKLLQQCDEEGLPATIESVLSKVRTKIDAIGPEDRLVGLSRGELSDLEREICSQIALAVNPPPDTVPAVTPHGLFAAWAKKANRTVPLEVFTTNYDVLLERAFEEARLPHFDGFVGTHSPFFFPECLEDESQLPKASWIRLWKLHGSVNWSVQDFRGSPRIIRSQPSGSGEMILPSHRKYDESRKQPYVAYMDRLSRVLSKDHTLLITCGYSFADAHLNAIIYGALDNCRTTNVVALQFHELQNESVQIAAALRRSNFSVIGPSSGILGGVYGKWQLTQPVDQKTWQFMDIAFDSDAVDPSQEAGLTDGLLGRLRLGDFKWFCHFLTVMGPTIQ